MFPKLFSPVRIGGLEIKNRVAMTAMGVNLAAAGGGVNDDIIAFYEARARGGVGLMVSGLCRVMDGAGAAEPCQLAARNVGDVQGLARLMDTVHKVRFQDIYPVAPPRSREQCWGWRGAASLGFGGCKAHYRSGSTCAHSSGDRENSGGVRDGARMAQMASADGVELHGAHGYLINSFLSPYLNRRDDEYGGVFANRLRFLMETLAGIRSACGKGFPLGVRISAEEFLGDRGNDLAASCRIAVELEKAGVDFLDISSTIPDSPKFTACIEPGTIEQGWKKYMAAEIKKHVRIPIIAVANIKEPAVAEAILEEGCCDLVGVARGHLADPDWCKKAKTGKTETISKCIGCLVCFDEICHERRVKCSVNPTTGREREFANPTRDGAGRTVAVVGGGPAGVTAAMVLRDRGFHVVLFEPSLRLGGSLNVADKGFAREKITRYVDSMMAQVAESGVELRLGEEATVEKVQALAPCGVFIACGARPFIPPVPGIDCKTVAIAEDVLVGRSEAKGDCAIVGSGMTGLETAEFVMRAGHKTTLVDMLPQIGAGANIIVILDIKERMDCYDPVNLPGHRLLRVTEQGIDLERMETGESVFVAADTVILAMGVRPHKEVVDRFKAAFPDARIMGDAVRGGRIVDATQDAYGQAFVFEP